MGFWLNPDHFLYRLFASSLMSPKDQMVAHWGRWIPWRGSRNCWYTVHSYCPSSDCASVTHPAALNLPSQLRTMSSIAHLCTTAPMRTSPPNAGASSPSPRWRTVALAFAPQRRKWSFPIPANQPIGYLWRGWILGELPPARCIRRHFRAGSLATCTNPANSGDSA